MSLALEMFAVVCLLMIGIALTCVGIFWKVEMKILIGWI